MRRVSTAAQGHISELLVQARLLALGYDIAKPSIDDHGVDLLVKLKSGWETIQTKCARVRDGNRARKTWSWSPTRGHVRSIRASVLALSDNATHEIRFRKRGTKNKFDVKVKGLPDLKRSA